MDIAGTTTDTLQLVVTSVVAAAALIVAWVYIRSQVTRSSHAELAELADTRGQRVDDLEELVGPLQSRIERLEGAVAAVEAIKADSIAQLVIDQVPERVVAILAESGMLRT